MSFTPSPYQQAIFDFVQSGRGSALIDAVAGSGKTTTIVKALELIPADKSILFLAFNKSIARELGERVPKHVRAATFHAQGFSAWLKFNRTKPNVDGRKSWNVLDALVQGGTITEGQASLYGSFATKLVGLAKGAGVGYLVPNEPATFFDLKDHFDVYVDAEDADEEEGIAIARAILTRSNDIGDRVIDFDDMLYLPLIHNVAFWKNDFVFVDEAQDTNAVQLALLGRMLKRDGRLVAVGDPFQAIYGFRGADADAMKNLAESFSTTRLPLSVSYRCPRRVVEVAKTIVPHIEASATAAEGEVKTIGDNWNAETFAAEDAILCRNTKPLVELCYSLLRHGVASKILGREIGQGLVTLVKKMKGKGLEATLEKLNAYVERETAKHVSKGREDKAQAVEDRVESIFAIAARLPETERTVPGLVAAIEELFSERSDRGILTLCTVHKSKGLEFDRVFVLDADRYMPSKFARKAWQQVQENNLIYVAYTRAKRELVFMSSKEKQQ